MLSRILPICLALIVSACQGIKPQLGEQSYTNQKKICTVMRIEDNESRIFYNTLTENLGEHKLPNCDYILYITLYTTKNSLQTVSGIQLQNSIVTTAKYYLFRYDNAKFNEINNIINNPSILENSIYTGRKNTYIALSRTREYKRNVQLRKDYTKSYSSDVLRLSEHLKVAAQGQSVEKNNFASNPLLITTETQGEADARENIVKTIANHIFNDVSIDVLEDIEEPKDLEIDENFSNLEQIGFAGY